MAKIPKRIICLVSAAVIMYAHIPVAHAEALPNVLEGSATLADNIMSYYALSGAAVANSDWINTLYDSYGSSFGTIYDLAENGMLTLNNDGTWQATTALETAIENAPAYQSLGLDQIFNVSAQEAAAGGGIAASGAATLAGSLGGVASTGVLTLFGGVSAAYWGGIAIGNLINHLTGAYGKKISVGAQITITSDDLAKIPVGGSLLTNKNGNNHFIKTFIDSSCWGIYSDYPITGYPNNKQLFIVNGSDVSKTFNFVGVKTSGEIYEGTNSINAKSIYNYGYSRDKPFTGYTYIGDSESFDEYYNDLKKGKVTKPEIYSPDIIGPDGNQEGDYDPDSGKYQVPYMLPQVDPSVQSGKPLTIEEWLRFANGAKSNNSDPDGKTKNKKLFDDILDEIRKGVPSTPDNPDPDPYHPPTPTPVPDPDYGDPNPDQPEFESETDVPDPVDTGKPWVTPDLLDKFPFCIPKDMIDMVKGFKSADRTAPHISWNFKSPVGHVDYTFNLDLEDFEDVATLLRSLELAAFIVGLAFATRYLIGAS